MIFKKIMFWIEFYVLNLPCYLFHEICHWLYVMPFWVIGITSFPKIIVRSWASMKIEGHNQMSTNSHNICINYDSYFKANHKWLIRSCAIMPLFGTIILFIISPWYMWIYYISQISTLLPGVGDINNIMGNLEKEN